MPDNNQDYGDLPRLRAQLAEYRAAGHHPEATELAADIERLTTAAKRDAAQVVRERNETKERFQQLIREIRGLQGSAAEVPGGPEARDARIRDLAAEARVEKARHEELTERVREFKWILTAEEPIRQRGAHSADETARSVEGVRPEAGTVSERDHPRRRWLVPAIVGTAVIVLGAGLFGGSLVVDSRAERVLEDRVTELLIEQDLDEMVSYDDLSVSSLLGTATVSNVAIGDPDAGDGVRADRITVRVPHLEALRARSALDDDGVDVRFSSVVLDAEGLVATTAEGEAFRVESVRGGLEGDLSLTMLEEPLEDQILRIDRAEITIAEAELLDVKPVLEGLRELGWSGDVSDLTRLDEFHAELSHDRSRREITLSDYRLATPLLGQSGGVRVAYEGDLGDPGAWVREAEIELQSTVRESPGAFVLPGYDSDESIIIDLPQAELSLSGATVFADDSMEPDLGRSSADVSLVIGEGAVALPPSAVEELSGYIDEVDEIVSAGVVQLQRFGLEAGLQEGGTMDLRELSLRAPFAEFLITGQARVDDIDAMLPGSISLSGSVERLPPSLREPLGELATMLGAIVPTSGPFEFSFALDESGGPVLLIE